MALPTGHTSRRQALDLAAHVMLCERYDDCETGKVPKWPRAIPRCAGSTGELISLAAEHVFAWDRPDVTRNVR